METTKMFNAFEAISMVKVFGKWVLQKERYILPVAASHCKFGDMSKINRSIIEGAKCY